MTTTPIETVLAALGDYRAAGERKWMARCPSHDDRAASLSIGIGDDGRVLLRCFAGCEFKAVVSALGLEPTDLFARDEQPMHKQADKQFFQKASDAVAALEKSRGRRSQSWIYHAASGEPVGIVVRWNRPDGSKQILPVSRRGSQWIHGAMEFPRPLYRLPELERSTGVVFVCEGEKAADAIESLGLTATTSAGGSQAAAKTSWSACAGRSVVILPDNDAAGEKYALTVQAELAKLKPTASTRIVRLPGLATKEDAYDFVERRREDGKDDLEIKAEIEAILAAHRESPTVSPSVSPEPRVTTLLDATRAYVDGLRNGQSPLVETGISDLDYAIGGGVERGELIILAARPSHGKSAVGLQFVHHWTSLGMPCAIISEEMSQPALGKRALQFLSPTPQERWADLTEHLDMQVNDYERDHAKCIILEGCGDASTAVSSVERAIEQHQVQAVIVDYAQLLRGPGRSRYEQMTAVSVTLRQLATKHKLILVALTQMSRDIENRSEFKPTMADIKETGQFEQDADVVIFLCWPWRLNAQESQSRYQFFVEKNRNRPINQRGVDCSFDPIRQMVSMPEIRCPFGG
jgi:KaiC/GvpD/RAD55 family RecA-like ATPase/5S rRNA maturation endonuclease (ribonuclease M5)